jgi:rubredoxin
MKNLECEKSNITVLSSISGEDDLKPMPRMIIDPPPEDGRCECCGGHIRELKPYDNSEYPKFIGTYLIKTFRRDLPLDKEAERALNEAEANCKEGQSPRQWLIEKYGEEKGNALNIMGHGSSTVSTSWECRDCIVLDEKEYFEKLWKSQEGKTMNDKPAFGTKEWASRRLLKENKEE